MSEMKTVERVTVTQLFPLVEKQVVMAHVAPDLGRDRLGPVILACDGQRLAMECVGVGETGNEVAVMLRPLTPARKALNGIVAALTAERPCPLYLERVAAGAG